MALGLLADVLVGDEPLSPHPVALFGTVMTALEGRMWRDERAAGALYALAGVGVGVAAGIALDRVPGGVRNATYVATAARGLWSAASSVGTELRRGDLEAARGLLPALVGRDPTGLDEKEISRAVVESVAENTVDAIVAPVLWALAGGAPGALGYRAVNTLDSMVGHRSERYLRFGWASARLDDAAAFVPARMTALLVALARPRRAVEVARAVGRDARHHPSPNAGFAEAAFAGALGLVLGGENDYGGRRELRPSLGEGRPPEPADIDRATRLSKHVTLLLGGMIALPAAVRALGQGSRKRLA